MDKCNNWAGAIHSERSAMTVAPTNSDSTRIIRSTKRDKATVTVPEIAGSQRRRGSTDRIMDPHLLAGAGFSFTLLAAASVML